MYECRIVSSINSVDAKSWDSLNPSNNPFVTHAFLKALEESGSICAEKGIQPTYLTLWDSDQLIGACPSYLKGHSFGEFIFDWSWAQAAAQMGISYHPKFFIGTPFTPATGPRFMTKPGEDHQKIRADLISYAQNFVVEHDLSGLHILFCPKDDAFELDGFEGPFGRMQRRYSCQYHWQNRDFKNYDDFLETLKSRHRKQIRKERRCADDVIIHNMNGELTRHDIESVYTCYLENNIRHGNEPYLTPKFFFEHLSSLKEMTHIVRAESANGCATSISFHSNDIMYGRYWGCTEAVRNLHFEVSYHQLIDEAIQRGYSRVEAGAQGWHKIKRGFSPVYTHSLHWIRDERLWEPVQDYLHREKDAVDEHIKAANLETPYKAL